MDLKQIEYFVGVAEAGSLTRAGDLLGVTQPSLSRQLRALELELGEPLLYRNGRGVTLTEAGKSLLPHCHAILAEVRAAKEHIQELKSVPGGNVAVGLTAALASSLTPRLVETFRARYAAASITITEGLSANLLEWLVGGRIDLALLYLPEPTASIEWEELSREELMLVCGVRKQLPLPAAVGLRELAGFPLVLPCVPNGIRMLVEAHCKAHGVALSIVAEVNAVQSLMLVAEASDCYTILPANKALEGVNEGKLSAARIHSPAILNMLVLGSARTGPESRIARAAKQILRELVQ